MRTFLKNLALGIPLALGAMLTLVATVMALRGNADGLLGGLFVGLIGIPILFASLTLILNRD